MGFAPTLCSLYATSEKDFSALYLELLLELLLVDHSIHTNTEAKRPSFEVSRQSVTIVIFGQNVMQMERRPIGRSHKAGDEMRR